METGVTKLKIFMKCSKFLIDNSCLQIMNSKSNSFQFIPLGWKILEDRSMFSL